MLTLVIPIYRNEASLSELLSVINNLNEALDNQFEAVFVVDGSPDRSYEILREKLLTCLFRSQLILLSRNFGSLAAVRAGLKSGEGQRFAVMAADLQEPPELILQMDKILREAEIDVVVAVRESRKDPLITRLFAHLFWSCYKRFIIKDMPPGGIDIFGCTRLFRDQLLLLEESHSSLVAQIFWLGYRRSFIRYSRQKRKHGKSGWTFSKKTKYMWDSIFSFTDLPIKLLIRIGGLGALFSGLLGFVVIFCKLLNLFTVPGYAANMSFMLFFSMLNLFCLGIIGSYTWRTYENTKARPSHLVICTHLFNQDKLKKDEINDGELRNVIVS